VQIRRVLNKAATMADIAVQLADALRDHYLIERQVGRGGMATVYLARDLKHDRLVAFKVLHPELAATLGPERFLQEIRLAARLDHPHILPVFDSGEAGGLLWYSMPYVEGESLRERLQREGQLPVEEAIRVARDVADALDCAHEKGIIHRDIKPENILLGYPSRDRTATAIGQVRVADFGLARAVEAAGAKRLTETGLAVGTPAYMSPEQASAAQVDGRTDIYALGCVLFEMLAGEPPYTGPTAQAVIAKRLTMPIPRLSTVRAVPPGIEAVVTRALAKAPADRFATASEFSRALQNASFETAVPGRRIGRGRLVAGTTILLALAVSWGLWKSSTHTRGSGAAAKAPPPNVGRLDTDSGPSLAVLPFANLSPDRESEYFSDGMTEELITTLGRVEGLRVAARTSAFALKGKNLDVRAIGETLHVATLLEGSVRRAGDQLRVAAQLVDARTGYHLWSDEYDRKLKDVFAVQAELARAIVGALRGRLKFRGGAGGESLAARPPELEAHDLYLEGRYELNQRTYESLRRAESYFDRAVAEDSTYARAYEGLADTYSRLPLFGPVRPREAYQQAKRAAERALALDSALDGAHAALGDALMLGDYDWYRSEAEYRRTILLNPSYAIAHNSYANLLRLLGRLEEAVVEREQARSLDPLSRPISAEVGRDLEMVRRFDDALRQLRTTLESDSTFARAHLYLCLAYLSKRAPREATSECQRAVALSGRYQGLGPLAYAYAASGDRPKAIAILHELEDRSRREYVAPWEMAVGYLGLGNVDQTFAWLDSAYTARDPLVTLGLSEPIWDPIRGDSRFAALRARMGLK
jgi:serine/threonine protein kinase/tetratricopeptide (TPR) repeat protein